ncbi:chorismate-binding protein [Symbiobacterium terraclitae]|uniref:chorismate-binding protein n=1 Tax=Symbiobacterium terraclitae TaxID=557451 RepID=UPI0035B51A3E
MARPEGIRRLPLPPWTPADLAGTLGVGPVALLDGLTWQGRRVTLVAWAPAARAGSIAEACRAAERVGLPEDAPPLLAAAVGRLDWDGQGRFWIPGSAALFDREGGELWVRGALPAVTVTARSAALTPETGRPSGPPPGAPVSAVTPPSTDVSAAPPEGVGLSAALPPAAGLSHAASSPTATGAAPAAPPATDPATGPVRAVPLWPYRDYAAAVREALAAMGAGSVTKVILSVPFAAPCSLSPLSVYRRLTAGASAGLAFLIHGGPGAEALVGLSPEPLVILEGRRARMHLLAGTRTPDRAAELAASPKDREEHRVAVEQARRDLLAVCIPGSVTVDAFMELERHPGLVHLASRLSGTLRPGATPADLVAACFPAGTVGGIPRAEARALIDRLEPVPRGWYAGAVGAVLPGGDLQLWLTIRSMALHGGTALVRTGAGLVPGSDPAAEWQECMAKAQRALAAAGAALPPPEEVMRHDDAVRA